MKIISIFALTILLQGSEKTEFLIRSKQVYLAFGNIFDEYEIDVYNNSELIFSGEIGPNDASLSNPYIFADKKFRIEDMIYLSYIIHKKGTAKEKITINRITIPVKNIQNRNIVLLSIQDISIMNQQGLTEGEIESSPSVAIRKDKRKRIKKYVIHSSICQK